MGDVVKLKIQNILSRVDLFLSNNLIGSILKVAETKTGVKRSFIAIGLLTIVSIYLIFGWANDFLCNFIGLIYPIFASVSVLQSPDEYNAQNLLIYWIIYSSLTSIEYFAHKLFDFLMIYWLAKCIFLIWFLTSGPYVIKKTTDDQLRPELPDDENKSSIAVESGNNEKRDEHTVAGGYGFGIKLNDFISVNDIEVDDDGTVYVADWMNARIVQWKCGATTGEIVAGGNGRGEENNQLKQATNFVYDKKSDSFIICDTGNSRVIRWPRGSQTSSETIVKGFGCVGIAIDDQGFIYISDETNSEVRRWKIGDAKGTLVAGGNGEGDRLDQLYCPSYLFVDKDHSVYITDRGNNRVVKWTKGAKEGIVVAGIDGAGSSLSKLTLPAGVIVDEHETVYVADSCNNRVVKWPKDAKEGIIFIGGSELNNEIDSPQGLAFDGHGNIYIADSGNYRVQKYPIDSN